MALKLNRLAKKNILFRIAAKTNTKTIQYQTFLAHKILSNKCQKVVQAMCNTGLA